MSAAIVWKGNADLRPLLIPLAQLDEDLDNARIHTDQNLATIGGSVQTFGQVKPLVGWREPSTKCPRCGGAGKIHYSCEECGGTGLGRVIVMCGNGTLSRIRALGWTHAAVSIYEGKRHEARALAIADNKASDFGKWNEEKLATQVAEVSAAWRAEGAEWVEEKVFPTNEEAAAARAPASAPVAPRAAPEPPALSSFDSAPPRAPASAPEPAAPKTYARSIAEKIASLPDSANRVGLIDSVIRRVIKRAAEVAGEHVANHDPWDTKQIVEALADEEVS